MTLLNDILKWATTSLTAWQRDTLRRLFQKEVLDQRELEDLYAMLKSAHGVPDPENPLRSLERFAALRLAPLVVGVRSRCNE